jgi:hypothetical protein
MTHKKYTSSAKIIATLTSAGLHLPKGNKVNLIG